MTHRGHFRQDRHGDFGRRFAADVQADGSMQAAEFGLGEVEHDQAFMPLLRVEPRAQGPDVERR